jgi:D-alanyl-D-alanine carboxypeptidase
MGLRHFSPGRRLAYIGLLATLALAGVDWNRAQARGTPAHVAHEGHKAEGHKDNGEARKGGGRHGVLHGSNYHPLAAAIVVDDNTGQAIYEVNADEPRHPASLTKIMTLYMLFERLEAGKLKLDTPLPVSAHAAGQNPVKLGLKAGQTIAVEDALKAMVTKSANDAACVVAEAIGGGDEAEGARLMTAKARALGMSSTTYVNGSGLPAEEQITTARDQALLGLIIANRFPTYYRYFSTLSFNWHGKEMHNHNGLLGNVPGVDGIKTGYTEASGYNLVASVRRDPRHIVAVVLGGTSNGARDALMRKLIEEHIPHASAQRTTPPITEVATADGTRANPVLTPNGSAPTTFTPAPVAAAPAVAPAAAVAPAVASPAAATPVATPAAAAAPAVAARGNIETVNPLSAAATLIPGAGAKVDPAHGEKPGVEAAKPHSRGAKLKVHVSAQPQVPGATPVAATTHVVHQNPHPLSNRTAIEAGAGTQLRHVPTKAGTPQTMLR